LGKIYDLRGAWKEEEILEGGPGRLAATSAKGKALIRIIAGN